MYVIPVPWLLVAGAAVGVGYAVYNNWDDIVESDFWRQDWGQFAAGGGHATRHPSDMGDPFGVELGDFKDPSGSDTETEGKMRRKEKHVRESPVASSSAVADPSEADIKHRSAFSMPSSADSKINMEILESETDNGFTSEFSLVSDQGSSWDFSDGDADIE